MFDHLAIKLTYLGLLGIVIAIEHLMAYEAWRHNELARRVTGIATVMGGALILVVAGVLDFVTWAIIMAGFCVAGAVTGALHTNRQNRERKQRLDPLRESIDAIASSETE